MMLIKCGTHPAPSFAWLLLLPQERYLSDCTPVDAEESRSMLNELLDGHFSFLVYWNCTLDLEDLPKGTLPPGFSTQV